MLARDAEIAPSVKTYKGAPHLPGVYVWSVERFLGAKMGEAGATCEKSVRKLSSCSGLLVDMAAQARRKNRVTISCGEEGRSTPGVVGKSS